MKPSRKVLGTFFDFNKIWSVQKIFAEVPNIKFQENMPSRAKPSQAEPSRAKPKF